MDCRQAHDMILLSDDPTKVAGSGGDAQLAQHVGGCADCQSLVARLTRIESIAASLPAPVEGSAEGRLRTLERVRATERTPSPFRRLMLRPALIGALAASLLVGIGVTAWLWPQRQAVRQQAVVEELFDFNEALAEASPQERERLYAEQAPVLRSAVEGARLSEADLRLAKAVLDAPATQTLDPVARVERLEALSDLLVRQLGPAAAANDELALQRLSRRFNRVQRGIGAHLNDKAWADVSPERSLEQAKRLELQAQRQARLEQVRKRQEEARKRLQRLAERSPQKAQKVLQRMLDNAERQRQQGPGKRPATQPRLDPDLH